MTRHTLPPLQIHIIFVGYVIFLKTIKSNSDKSCLCARVLDRSERRENKENCRFFEVRGKSISPIVSVPRAVRRLGPYVNFSWDPKDFREYPSWSDHWVSRVCVGLNSSASWTTCILRIASVMFQRKTCRRIKVKTLIQKSVQMIIFSAQVERGNSNGCWWVRMPLPDKQLSAQKNMFPKWAGKKNISGGVWWEARTNIMCQRLFCIGFKREREKLCG